MTHIYAVPTHRLMNKENINDYFSEVSYANQKTNDKCLLIFFEDSDKIINLENIKSIAKEYEDVNYLFITRPDTVYIYDYLYSKLPSSSKEIFKKLYPNSNVNYGNVFNRIFIFAMLLGADTIHRRDSDVLIDIANDGSKVYPIEVELNSLGKKCGDNTIYICGGGYKEKYDLDIDGLIRDNGNDYTLVKELFSCMSIPESSFDTIINEEILGNNKPFEHDVIDEDSGCFPECGNVSLYEIFKYFPSSCQDFILGSDYFFIDVAEYTNLNICYHNRAVIHRHTSERKSQKMRVLNYWSGLMMLIDSQIYYHQFYYAYLENRRIDFNVSSWLEDFVDNMRKSFDLFKKNSECERINKLNDTIKVLSQAEDSDILSCIDDLSDRIDSIISYTNASIEEHIQLMIEWKNIVSTIDEIRNDEVIKSFFYDKKCCK